MPYPATESKAAKPGVSKPRFRKTKKTMTKKEMVTTIRDLKNRSALIPEPEVKCLAADIDLTNITNGSPLALLLNPMLQGDDSGERIGDIVQWVEMDMNFKLFTTNSTNDNSTTQQRSIRCVLVREKPCLGAAISLTSLFGTTTPNTYSLYNHIQRDFGNRFYVLYDKTFVVDGLNFEKNVSISNKKLRFKTHYNRGNAGTIDDIDTNSVYFLCFTDHNDLVEQYVVGEYQMFYKDN